LWISEIKNLKYPGFFVKQLGEDIVQRETGRRGEGEKMRMGDCTLLPALSLLTAAIYFLNSGYGLS
jgi:hypothetical protein